MQKQIPPRPTGTIGAGFSKVPPETPICSGIITKLHLPYPTLNPESETTRSVRTVVP